MRILLVEDDELLRSAVAKFLEEQIGHHVTQSPNGKEALELFKENPFPMVLTDIRMPGGGGVELLNNIRKLPEGKTTDVVLMTAHGDMQTSVQALRAGAYDYLLKPVEVEVLASVVARIAEHQKLLKENYELQYRFQEKVEEATRESDTKFKHLQNIYSEVVGIGKIGIFSNVMRKVVELAEVYHGDRAIPVLIEGETGTGKEIIARLVHYGTEGFTGPLVSINCSAIPAYLFESELFGYEGGSFSGALKSGNKGKFELANGGTIFFDEIGDMPLELQPKLLRAIQEREIFRIGGLKKIPLDVRIICATNRKLSKMVEAEKFRPDLYYRLSTGSLSIPPLRERPEAIEHFALLFLDKYASKKKRQFKLISKKAVRILEQYTWPGNIRELENLVETIVLLYDGIEITAEHLKILTDRSQIPTLVQDDRDDRIEIMLPPEGLRLKDAEKRIIQKVLHMFDGNKTRAAEYLGITRKTLRQRLQDT
ncbi:MAG: sigma-54-dependent Fis family transcriptional regulator [bacterium]|nr:sigma-54-dependent Fis family transcriptional regulator [bacterium]